VIYAYPGLGSLMVDAVRNHDLPLIQGIALTYCSSSSPSTPRSTFSTSC